MISYFSELGIDILNIEDPFFNDICFPYSNSVSDIVLKDRISDIYQNFSLCENNCEYDGINLKNMSISCLCKVKKKVNTDVEHPIFGHIVEDTFIYSNFGVIKCYKLVFSLDNKKNNFGFIVFLALILIHIPLYIYYFIFKIRKIQLFVFKEMDKNNYLLKINFPPIRNKKRLFSEKKSVVIIPTIRLNNKKYSTKNLKKKSCNNLTNSNFQINSSKSRALTTNKKSSFIKKHRIKRISLTTINQVENNPRIPGYYHLIQINANNSSNRIPPDSRYILDNYDYETAIKYDNRTFCRIFYICLLSKENILNTFFFKSFLEIQAIRFTIFIFSYSCDLALNAFFYLNKKISDKYHYEGNDLLLFTLINNLTISISSTIFSFVLVKSLQYLTNSKDEIESIFRLEEKKMREDITFKVDIKSKKMIYLKLRKIFGILKIKLRLYIITEFILMLFFFYYITAFCEVYKETQISWVIDSFLSFLLSILTELLNSFITSIFYSIALKFRLKTLYKIVMYFYSLG